MKKYLLIIMALVGLVSCTRQIERIEPPQDLLTRGEVQSVLDEILSLGFAEEDIVEYEDYYLVEEDIRFDKDRPNTNLVTRQTRSKYLLSVKEIKIYLPADKFDDYIYQGYYFRQALNDAVAALNAANSGLLFSVVTTESEANVKVVLDTHTPASTWGEAIFPRPEGRPYDISLAPQYFIDKNISTVDRTVAGYIAHLLGHTVGLAHANSFLSSDPQAGQQILDTPKSDVLSIMNRDPASAIRDQFRVYGLSLDDKKALVILYPIVTEPEPNPNPNPNPGSYVPLLGTQKMSLAMGDFDGDGKADIAVVTANGRIYLSCAQNGFSKWDWSAAGYVGGKNYYFADVTGDGKDDLIMTTSGGHVYISYYGHDRPNGFGAWNWSSGGYVGGNNFHFTDVTGDGKADMILTVYDRVYISYYNHDRPNGFGAWNWIEPGYTGGNNFYFADVTGDKKADLIMTTTDGRVYISYYDHDRPGGFGAWNWSSGGYVGGKNFYFADVTGDGKADMILTVYDRVYISYYDHDRPNGFGAWNWSAAGYIGGNNFYFADVTGDKKADLIMTTADNKIYISYYDHDRPNGFGAWNKIIDAKNLPL